jgi:hypothetical protein
VAKAAGKAAGQVIGEGDGLSVRYDAFGDIGTILKELKWKVHYIVWRYWHHSQRA